MKKNTSTANAPITSAIGTKTTFTGNIRTDEAIRIDGHVVGDITSTAQVIIGKDGIIEGNIIANSLITAGTITGNLTLKEKIEILQTAAIKGDISSPVMIMDENAVFEGKCSIAKNTEVKEKAGAPVKGKPADKEKK